MVVLIVEDELLSAMLLEDMLKALGHEIVGPAASVAQAMNLADMPGVEAALLDLNLRGERSLSVAQKFIDRKIPFAFVTGYMPDHLDSKWRSFPLLQKPFMQDTLKAMLEQLGVPA